MGELFEFAVNAVSVVPLPFSFSVDQPVNAVAAEAAGFAARPRPSSSAGIAGFKLWKRHGDPEFKAGAIRDAVQKAVEGSAMSEGTRRVKRAVLATGHGLVAVDAVESTAHGGEGEAVLIMAERRKIWRPG